MVYIIAPSVTYALKLAFSKALKLAAMTFKVVQPTE